MHSRTWIGPIWAITVFVIAADATATRFYVDVESQGGNGTSWGTAFSSVQDALELAAIDDEVWIADGVYIPTERLDPEDPRSATFLMVDGVILFGGFQGQSHPSGGETSLNQRNPNVYLSTLSGNIGDPEEVDDNVYHVVVANAVGQSSRLNGFVVQDGHASGTTSSSRIGGGAWILGDSTPLFIQCRFTQNHAETTGGAVHVDAVSEPLADAPQFLACTFDNNSSSYHAGAILVAGSETEAAFVNCLAYDNEAQGSGNGGFLFSSSGANVILINCTVTGNHTNGGSDHGAINLSTGEATIVGCILWGNTNPGGSPKAAQISVESTMLAIEYCDIQGHGNDL